VSADQAQLELLISAQADRVLAGLSSFERSLKGIEDQHKATGQAADAHGAKVEKFIGQMQRLANVGSLFIAWETIERVFSSFKGVEDFNTDLLRTTEILGGNAKAASTWSVIAEEMGVDVQTIDRSFAHLATTMNSGSSPALKQMGIAAVDTHGKLRPLNDVVNDSADYFHKHAGAVNNAALANALYGRSGYELLPALQQGRAGIAAITEEARKYGLILDAQTIQQNAQFTFQLKEAELAGRGLEISLGNALLPAVAAVGQGLSRLVSDNLPAFIGMINRAASYVIGFVEGLTGLDLVVGQGALDLGSLSDIVGDTGTAMDTGAGAAERLAEAERKVRDAAKTTTDAIDDQIRALNSATAAQKFADQQAKLQQDLANKTQDIQDLQREQYQEFWQGNFQTAADIGEKITRAQQDQAQIQQDLTRGVDDQNTKNKINALETQKRAVQKAADDQIAAMERAAHQTSATLTAAAASWPGLFGKGAHDAGLRFAKDFNAEGIGKDIGQQLMDAIFGKETQVTFEGHGTNEIVKTVRSGGGNWQKIGEAIGKSIGDGMATTLGPAATAAISSAWHSLGHKLDDVATGLTQTPGLIAVPGVIQAAAALRAEARVLQSFHGGGVVPGSRGQEVPSVLLARERVLTENQNDEIVSLLREQNGILRAIASGAASNGGSGVGALAAFNALLDKAARARQRGQTGAYVR
jgi:hypothetical protein